MCGFLPLMVGLVRRTRRPWKEGAPCGLPQCPHIYWESDARPPGATAALPPPHKELLSQSVPPGRAAAARRRQDPDSA